MARYGVGTSPGSSCRFALLRRLQQPKLPQPCWRLLAAGGSWRRLAARGSCPAVCQKHNSLSPPPTTHPSVQEYVKFDAIIVAGDTAYVGDMSIILDESSVDSMALKGFELRWASRQAGGAGGWAGRADRQAGRREQAETVGLTRCCRAQLLSLLA